MNSWFFGWPSELSDSDCDNLLSMYDPKLSKVAEVGHTNFRQNTELRKSKVVGINLFNDLHKEIADKESQKKAKDLKDDGKKIDDILRDKYNLKKGYLCLV